MIKSNIIFFGPRLLSVYGKKTIGGGTVLFENLMLEIKNNYHFINLNGDSKWTIKKYLYNIKLVFCH